jgi:hypothetical protein
MVVTKRFNRSELSEIEDQDNTVQYDFLNYRYFPPTGKYPMETRSDRLGDGAYASKRGSRAHGAWDVVATPGQSIYAPITGKVSSIANWTEPVPGKRTTAIRIIGTGNYDGQEFRLGYTVLDPGLEGTTVKRGSKIGTHQANQVELYTERNILNKDMVPHVHIDIKKTKENSLYGRDFASYDPYYLTWSNLT